MFLFDFKQRNQEMSIDHSVFKNKAFFNQNLDKTKEMVLLVK